MDHNGAELDASFAIEPTTIGADVVIESRGGSGGGPTRARNSAYAEGLELIFSRLAIGDAVLVDVLLDSRTVRSLPTSERRLLPQADMPVALRSIADPANLRHHIGRASAAFGRPASSIGGNPTKRIRLVLDWPAARGRTQEELERQLAGTVSWPVTAGAEWNEAELRICVEAYRRLWVAQAEGRPLGKAALRRETIARGLWGRSESAYEFRMQNISSVVEDLGIEIVGGYLPRRNVGRQKAVLIRLIDEAWGRATLTEAPTEDPEKLATRVESARASLRRRSGGGLPPPPTGAPSPPSVPASGLRFPRDPNVIAWVLEAAAGSCEVCSDPAPFQRADGEPYLEVHHVRQLAQGGPDTVDNAVAGCPNCHRRLHHGADRDKLRGDLLTRVPRLKDHPRRH